MTHNDYCHINPNHTLVQENKQTNEINYRHQPIPAVVTMHTVRDIDPEEYANMSSLLALDLTHATPQRFWLKAKAWKNILDMS